eukprot:3168071-Pleurochrysis_carterae.AAC.4
MAAERLSTFRAERSSQTRKDAAQQVPRLKFQCQPTTVSTAVRKKFLSKAAAAVSDREALCCPSNLMREDETLALSIESERGWQGHVVTRVATARLVGSHRTDTVANGATQRNAAAARVIAVSRWRGCDGATRSPKHLTSLDI